MSTRPVMKILYGPPGTGKTWLAAREAVGAIDPTAYARWRAATISDKELLDLHHQYVLSGRIKWVTFHPSYSYEDFVEGFRPVRAPTGATISFEVRKGPFREICETASGQPSSFGPPVGTTINAIGGTKTYEVIGANDQGWFLRVRPGRTDQVGEEQEKFVTRRVIEKAADLGFQPKVFSIPGKGDVTPSDYGLEGDDPVVGSELRRQVGTFLGISSSDLANSAHFGAVAAFIKDQSATAPKPTPCCLVIDEINRADLSRVFGELITLLEPDKRLGASEERRVHLPYSGEERFGVPGTLSVIGTMNTADRSISAVDFAMRRRFVFVEVAPNPALCPDAYGGVNVAAVVAGINRRIEVLRGPDYRLGHSTFMDDKLNDTRDRFGWPNNDEGRLKSLAYTLRSRVIPLLEEYFHEDLRKVEIALGTRSKRFGTKGLSLFEAQHLSAAEQELFGDSFDVAGLILGTPAAWWDPETTGFDSAAFAAAAGSMA
ncbi:McrB family protein [Bradyrhizobium sp. HKCCYLRH1065]|uniref:McrB family protein n=1 Tax=unclassified Bradyrhizobium TaxID=2631580 RepID=UPI003EB70671